MVWFMTDPRFWEWLWAMDNEIRKNCPLVYYHVWDNYPYPTYNDKYYKSNDVIVSISKVTHDIVNNVAPEVENIYHPHAVNDQFFRKMSDEDISDARKKNGLEDKFVFLWNNRNARRKQSGSLIYWFKDFCDKVGHDKAVLIMHTDPKDPYGQDLEQLLVEFEMNKGQVRLSKNKVSPADLAVMYNIADCTVNISDAEGFGLATLESLSCETPIIVTMTGGLQEQVTDGEKWFGIGIEPSSKSVIGSQQVPFIYEDRVSGADVVNAFEKMYNMSKEERENLGKLGRQHVENNYNFKKYEDGWVEIMDNIHEKHGSWTNRKNYKSWQLSSIN
jgi:glycosyltransferase involved in cell wall biosynthesis